MTATDVISLRDEVQMWIQRNVSVDLNKYFEEKKNVAEPIDV